MSDDTTIEVAAKRLQSAIAALELATKRRSVSEGAIDNLQGEIQALSEDRSKLAQELDQVRARNAQLERVNEEVSRRLSRATEAFEGLLDRD
jgi:FtsZ-binding cell division protein ZapB